MFNRKKDRKEPMCVTIRPALRKQLDEESSRTELSISVIVAKAVQHYFQTQSLCS